MQLKQLKDLNVHVVGISSVEGAAITEFLFKSGCKKITAHDFCEEKEFVKNFAKFNANLSAEQRKGKLKVISNKKISKHFKSSYLKNIEKADLIFVGQAWYKYRFNFPKLSNAQKKGVPFKTIINLYLDYFPGTTIGITGSNGKTTVTSLTYHILKSIRKNIFIAGNIDSEIQALDKIATAKKSDILVLEISNRQLKLLGESAPDLALITNITENHLDEHDGIKEYAETKFKIAAAKKILLNEKDPLTKKFLLKNLKPIWFNDEEILKEFRLKESDLKILGKHNLENLYAALQIIKTLNLKPDIQKIKKAVRSFKGVAKRLEIIGEKNKVKIVNDLSSTTPTSTVLALDAFPADTFSLVLGCNHKGGSYAKLIKKLGALQKKGVLKRIFLLPGTIRGVIKKSRLQTTDVKNFEDIAKIMNPKLGDYLIISPSGEKVISVHLQKKSLKKIFYSERSELNALPRRGLK